MVGSYFIFKRNQEVFIMKYTLAQLESLIAKARLLGTLNQLNTKCGHAMYLFKNILDGVTLLHIPDDVETVEEEEPSYGGYTPAPTYCNIECKTLMVSGGRSLRDANKMFFKCKAQSLDLSNFDTSSVTNMSHMFEKCEADLLDLSSLDTSNVTDMSFLFTRCLAESLDLSSFDTSRVTTMRGMFNNYAAESLDLRPFDTSNVTDMSFMFGGCDTGSIELSSFDTSSVTTMEDMFYECDAGSIDLSSFDTSSVTTMEELFKDCYAAIKATDPKILEELNKR
jgi:surface protein